MTQQTFFIKAGYTHRSQPDYFEDAVQDGVVWQPDVYAAAACLARRLKCTHLIDIGCGQAGKLAAMSPEFNIVGVDYGPNLQACRCRYPDAQWFEADLESIVHLPIPTEIAARSVIICSDVIEHLKDPTDLLRLLRSLLNHAPALILSTPERDLCRGEDHSGPPPNRAHVREWNREEMGALLHHHGFTVDFIGLTTRNSETPDKHTLIALVANNRSPVPLVPNVPWGHAIIVNDRDIIEDLPATSSEPPAAPPVPACPTGSRLTLLLFVDALRPDYVRRTSFLKELAARSDTGCLRERFGFVQHPAYFGGIPDFPFTNQYCFDPASSPFHMARALPASPAGPGMEHRSGVRALLDQSARERVTRYAATYVNSMSAPLCVLPFFSPVEQHAPWDPRVGYRSVFQQLDAQGVSWLQCCWPASNLLPDHSDVGIVRHVLGSLRPEHRFAFVHLQELDGVGHQFGPNSQQLDERLLQTDALCRQLLSALQERYRHLDLVLFGDHGMVNVTRNVDVAQVLASTGLQLGVDYVAFLDSTMARFWFFHAQARRRVAEALAGLPGGRILETADLKRYRLTRCDSRNGELIFLADPGVLIFPNYFQAGGEPIKGMHGYDPDCPDNLGYFLYHVPENDGRLGRDLGKVEAWELHPLLCQLLDLPLDGRQPPRMAGMARPRTGRFTPQPDLAADATVQAHLDAIVARVRESVGTFEAIVLTGSFGRGEGGAYKGSDGSWQPVNDYDLFVVSPHDCRRELSALGGPLAKILGLDFLDLGWTDGKWGNWPLTVASYDLKHGSQVIAGDQTVLDRLPAYASAGLPIYEAVKLLLNRTAGLLTGLRGEMFTGIPLTPEWRRYLANQIAKAQMALGDSYLIRWAGYDASYRLRRERFTALAPGAGLTKDVVRQVTQGYDFKLQPDYSIHADLLETICKLRPHLESAIIETVNRLGNGQARDLSSAMTFYLATMSDQSLGVRADNDLLVGLPALRTMLAAEPTAISLRHLVYSALPELLAAAATATGAKESQEASRCRLAPYFTVAPATEDLWTSWEMLRTTTVAAWFAIHH